MFVTPASLLYRLRDPNETAAWNTFVELYSPLMLHWAKQLGQQESDSADLVQEVFLILWRKLPEFEYDSGKSFHAWLKTIFLNRHRSRLRHRHPLPMDIEEGQFSATETIASDPEESKYLIRQAFRLIQAEFPAHYQEVFSLYVIGDRPPEEVATGLGISPGTVYSIKSKVLSRLRQELKPFLD